MRRLASVAVVIMCFASSAGASELTLTVAPNDVVVQRGELLPAQVTINNGGSTVTLVEPGDGSESGWRTPIIRWSFVTTDGKAFTEEWKRFCGNINPLKRSEVFTLKPMEKRRLEHWILPRSDMPAGQYRATFHYINDPAKLELGGVPLGPNEPGVEDLIKASTRCDLTSNEIRVTVTD